MTDIYYIGGLPCSGKSTIAEALSKIYNLYYFKVDDYLDRYMKMGALNKKEICLKVETMNPEQIWMRDSLVQCEEEFQIFHYSKREWVPYVLAECSNKEKAFENWMNRDVLFAEAVQQQCKELGYASLINNGELTVEELISKVVLHFGLG